MELLQTGGKGDKGHGEPASSEMHFTILKIKLPSINLPIKIPVNPLHGCIYSLLSDSNLMTSENLIYSDIDNPASVPEFGNKFSEINTGLLYLSFQKRIKHFDNAIQVPLIIFIDGTAIDRSCGHSQTPVMFHLG